MYLPLLTNHELATSECHLLVVHCPFSLSNKTDAKQKRQELIKTILLKYTKLPFKIETTGPGKPYLDTAEIHFNISHSRNILLIAISHFPIGIDFEFIKKKDYPHFSQYFWGKDLISTYPQYNQPLAFFQAWTQTEAWVKCRGETIFNHAEFIPHNLLSRSPIIFKNYKIVSFMPLVNTIASLCYDKRIKDLKLKQLDWSNVVHDYP